LLLYNQIDRPRLLLGRYSKYDFLNLRLVTQRLVVVVVLLLHILILPDAVVEWVGVGQVLVRDQALWCLYFTRELTVEVVAIVEGDVLLQVSMTPAVMIRVGAT
jgi:hypothetical protein